MSSSIDPITGLPADTPYTDQFQIPLNSNPIPLDDWQAMGRQNDVLYPDNIPPVLATISGQNRNTPQSAQSLQTDGEHRLLVNVDGTAGGSGSSGPIILANTVQQGEGRVLLAPNDSDYVPFDIPTYLVGLHCAAAIYDYGTVSGAGVYTQEVTFDIAQRFFGVVNLPLGGYFDGTSLIGEHTAHTLWYPPYPIDIRTSLLPGAGNFRVYIYNNSRFTVQAFVSALLGPPA